MRAWRTRLLAVIAALTLLAPASALAKVVYLCKMSGSIGPRCCCAHADETPETPASGPAVDRPSCCEAQVQSARDAVASAADQLPPVGPAVLVTTLTFEELAERARASATLHAPQARGPPAVGPPVYLENCSLLR
jgi:hypothetical protein